MRTITLCAIFAALAANLIMASEASAQATSGIALDPYVGGRVFTQFVNGNAKYTYSWPGVYFEAEFTGDEVDVKLDDDQNNLYLYVDGLHKLTLTRPGHATVALKDLGAGRHIVRLEKTSETQSSNAVFDGFYVASAEQKLPAPQHERRIEFIGDSFTVGYGNMSRGQVCTIDDVRDTTNTSEAFAPMTAKYFGAAYRINADSGHGVVRNYANREPGNTMPVLYNFALLDKSFQAMDEGWKPDVLVVGLGINDFSTQLAEGEPWKTRGDLRADFVSTYVAFINKLHAVWPAAHIILTSPVDDDHEVIDSVNMALDVLKNSGVTDLEVASFNGLDHMACDGHPSLKDEQLLSKLLIERISLLPKFAQH